MTDRNFAGIFFKISGFTPDEVDDIIYRQKVVKRLKKEQKKRKRRERWGINIERKMAKIDKMNLFQPAKKSKFQKTSEQIQNGFDVAKRLMEHGQGEQEEAQRDNVED